jgi:uncharacterized membrane protein
MISARLPFAEEAVAEFRSISERERTAYDKGQLKNASSNIKATRENNVNGTTDNKQLLVASMILVIKGDHTSSPFQSGISTKKDMGRVLLRIASDAQVENCLVGSEVMWLPHELKDGHLVESDILRRFPDIVPLVR